VADFLEKDKVAGFWDQLRKNAAEDVQSGYIGDEWPQAMGHNRFRGEWRQVTRWLDRYGVKRGRCLDVGCGMGMWLEHLAGRFEEADGIDLSSEMVESTRARMQRRGLGNVRVEHKDVAALDQERRYDFIFVGGVLMYVNDAEVPVVLAKLSAMLAPGGVLLLRETTHRGTTWYRDKPIGVGLHGDPRAPRPPYRVIYRPPPAYAEAGRAHGLTLLCMQRNRHYKMMDQTEPWLWLWNFLLWGSLRKNKPRAERVARWIYRLRWLTLFPMYYAILVFYSRGWKIENHWYVLRRNATQTQTQT